MLASLAELVSIISDVYAPAPPSQRFRFAAAVHEVKLGKAIDEVAKAVGIKAKKIEALAAEIDPLATIFRTTLTAAGSAENMAKARRGLGQMLVGELAERAFEDLYESTPGTGDLRLEDARVGRTETDYRVLNGERRPVFRINIKFHGTPFRRAMDLVQLDPGDCFPLATYKINQGVKKHDEEKLPYVFAIVGVPQLTGEAVGAALPENLVHLSAFVYASKLSGKRDIEDQIVRYLVEHPLQSVRETINEFASRIKAAEWRVISARRAKQLLLDKLFERVYAVRERSFARRYPRAEVDMHFSLSQDLTPLKDFLQMARDHGLHGLAVRLERGLV